MARLRLSLRRALFLSAFLALALFSVAASAQGNQKTTTTAKAPPTPAADSPSSSPDAAASTPTDDASSSPQDKTTSKTTAKDTPKTTATDKSTSSSSTTTSTGKMSLPNLSSTSATGTLPKLTGMPTLSKTVDTNIPTYPPPAVPPTRNAPFMQRSALPDGTVFIAVGAILGAFGAAVLLWRGIVACLLHRSVARANAAQHAAVDKAAAFPAPPAPFYKSGDRDSSPSLAVGAAAGRGARRTHRGPTPSATPSQTNLFFSPTAAGGGMNSASNRDSRFLPSGFYAAGTASPGGQPYGHGQSISLSNLRPDSRGHHGRALGPSPPDSPSLAPARTPQPRDFSSSSVNLYAPSQGRAPSAYLEDLLDDQGLPAPPGPDAHHRTYSQGSVGRY